MFRVRIVKLKGLMCITSMMLLVGCGGGGSNDSTPNIPEKPVVDNSDSLTPYIDVQAAYNGSAELAPITNDNLGEFFKYFFFIAEELKPSYVISTETNDELCPNGGKAITTDTDKATEKNVLFQNCVDGDFHINGDAVLRAVINSNGQASRASLIFKDVDLQTSFGSYKLRGTLTDITQSEDCENTRTVNFYNFLLTADKEQNQLLFKDFQVDSNGTMYGTCAGIEEGVRVNGRIYHSSLGYWYFSSSENIKLNNRLLAVDPSGELVINGANNSKAKWTVSAQGTGSTAQEIFHFSINDYSASFLGKGTTDETFYNFLDSDSDGMLDSWELIYNLEPNNALDAQLDYDNDGFTNLQEFLYFGIPNDDTSIPNVMDLSVRLDHETKSYSDPIPLTLHIGNNSRQKNASNVTAILNVKPPIKFIDIPDNCQSSEQEQRLVCQYGIVEYRYDTRQTFNLDAEQLATQPVNASVSAEVIFSGGLDTRESNNVDSLTLYRPKLDLNYRFDVDNGSSFEPDHAVLLENEEMHYRVRIWSTDIAGQNFARLDDIKLSYEMSDNVELLDGKCVNRSEITCLEDTSVATYDTDRNGNFYFNFKLKGIKSGQGNITFNIGSSVLNQQALFRIVIPTFVGKSTKIIQDKIDSAADGETVNVPDGVYLGGLDLSKKYTILKSKSGAENTSIFSGHEQYLHEVIRLGKGSKLSGFTLSRIQIIVNESSGIIEDNTLLIPLKNMSTVGVGAFGSTEFRRNQIKYGHDDFNSSANDNEQEWPCFSLNLWSGFNQEFVYNIVNNGVNLPENSKCNFVSIQGQAQYNIVNNTVLGIQSFATLNASYMSDGSNNQIKSTLFNLNVENNIFKGKESFFKLDYSTRDGIEIPIELDSNSDFIFDSNIIYGLTWETEKYNGNWVVEKLFQIDPLVGENFKLLSNSPAIDSAKSNGLSLDLYKLNRPIDGNSDGVAAMDIGASEFNSQ